MCFWPMCYGVPNVHAKAFHWQVFVLKQYHIITGLHILKIATRIIFFLNWQFKSSQNLWENHMPGNMVYTGFERQTELHRNLTKYVIMLHISPPHPLFHHAFCICTSGRWTSMLWCAPSSDCMFMSYTLLLYITNKVLFSYESSYKIIFLSHIA